MNTDEKMYTVLFNGITDVQRELENILNKLKEYQIKAEEIYLTKDDE